MLFLSYSFPLVHRPHNAISQLPTSLQSLQIMSSISHAEDYSHLPLAQLVIRDFNGEGTVAVTALPTTLVSLEISGLQAPNAKIVAQCPQLTHLTLQNCKFDGKELQYLPVELKRLYIFFSPSIQNLEYLTRLKNLTLLDLTFLKGLHEDSLQYLPPKLTKLILYEVPTLRLIIPKGIQYLELTGKFQDLQNVQFPDSITTLIFHCEIPIPMNIPKKLQQLKILQPKRLPLEFPKLLTWIMELPLTLTNLGLQISIASDEAVRICEELCKQGRSLIYQFDSITREVCKYIILQGKVTSSLQIHGTSL